VSLIALLYRDADTAATAAAVLSERLASFAAETIAAWGARVDTPRVYLGESGLAAAVASIRYPLAAAAQGGPPGGAFTMWLPALVTRDLDLLRIGP
jgi:hypothetical protein